MGPEFFTFKSDYLKHSYYTLGNYSLLKSNLFDRLLKVYFTNALDASPACDILVINIAGAADFRISACPNRYKCVIYTLRPFESIIRYLNYMIKYKCIIFDVNDRFIIVSLEYNIGNKPNMTPSSLEEYNGTRMRYIKRIEVCVRRFLKSYVRTERDLAEEDMDEAFRNAALKSTYNQRIQFHRLGGIVTYTYSRASARADAGRWKKATAAQGKREESSVNLPMNFQLPQCRSHFKGADSLKFHSPVTGSSWSGDRQSNMVMHCPRHCLVNMFSLFEEDSSSESSNDLGGFDDTQRKARYVQHRLEDGLYSDSDFIALMSPRNMRRNSLLSAKQPYIAGALGDSSLKRFKYGHFENESQSDPSGFST